MAASEKDLDKQSKEVATLKGALSTTETEVQLQKISVQSLEKAKTSKLLNQNPALFQWRSCLNETLSFRFNYYTRASENFITPMGVLNYITVDLLILLKFNL